MTTISELRSACRRADERLARARGPMAGLAWEVRAQRPDGEEVTVQGHGGRILASAIVAAHADRTIKRRNSGAVARLMADGLLLHAGGRNYQLRPGVRPLEVSIY